jgi:ribosome-binding factor A
MLVDDKEALLHEVKVQTKVIRQALGVKIRHQARIIPQLVFFLDESVDYAMKMENVFKGLHIPPTTPVDENDYDKLDQ